MEERNKRIKELLKAGVDPLTAVPTANAQDAV
jgi:hypothetical protein